MPSEQLPSPSFGFLVALFAVSLAGASGCGEDASGTQQAARPLACATHDECAEGICVDCGHGNDVFTCTYAADDIAQGVCASAWGASCETDEDCNAESRHPCERYECVTVIGQCSLVEIPAPDGTCMRPGENGASLGSAESPIDRVCAEWSSSCGADVDCPARAPELELCGDVRETLIDCWAHSPPPCDLRDRCTADFAMACEALTRTCVYSQADERSCDVECVGGTDAPITARCSGLGCVCSSGPMEGAALPGADCESLLDVTDELCSGT